MRNEWLAKWSGNFYLLKNVDKDFKEGDSFFERAGRMGPIKWDGKERLNYHCKKIISVFKPKQR
jgi:hypothetical protein